MTLISSIGESIAAVNWADTEHNVHKVYFGYLLRKYTQADIEAEMNYQNSLATRDGYQSCLLYRQICDLFGLSSANIDTQTKTALNGLAMLDAKHVPNSWTYDTHDYFLLYHRWCGHAYSVAKKLDYLTSKWDSSLAWQELKGVCDAAGHGVMAADPRDNPKPNQTLH